MGYSLPRGEGLFMSGNGYQSEFNDGGYAQQTFTHSFSKSSQGGGGGGGGGGTLR